MPPLTVSRILLCVVLALGAFACSSPSTVSSSSSSEKKKDPPDTKEELCSEGREACGDLCVDTSSNPMHCGACGSACTEGGKCQDGRCVESCSNEKTDCDGACVDLDASDEHCGGCGVACGKGASCTQGSCRSLCPAGEAPCGDSCVDLQSDAANCGACGNDCSAGLFCSKGACVAACESELQACGQSCVDTNASRAHCGSCDRACGSQQVCSNGLCILSCGEGLECDGRCVDIQNDDAHCGTCNWACAPGTFCQGGECACPNGGIYCEGECVNPKTNGRHCGSCGNTCTSEEVCRDGKCACPGELTLCNEFCTDTDSDPWNCGGCGVTCLGLPHADGSCVEGQCELECSPNFHDCNEQRADGCEAYVLSDENNCGACNVRCAEMPNVARSLGCDWGMCSFECKAGWGNCDNVSANGCEVNLDEVAEHCGSCRTNCHDLPHVETGACSGGLCSIVACMQGRHDCDENPANGCESDLLTDIDNCGQCGNQCPFGCKGGKCVGFVEIGAGSIHTCAATGAGKLWCWGDNNHGWLGNGETGRRVAPFEVGGIDGVVQVRGGSEHTCAIVGAGELWCWGRNDYGRLGDGTTSRSYVPKQISTSFATAQVGAGSFHTCALDTNGEVWCWGRNNHGQIGDGTTSNSINQLTPKKVSTLSNVKELRATGYHTCALDTNGEVWCWGTTGYSGSLYKISKPTRMAGGLNGKVAVQIETGFDHVCARTQDGELYCWGENEYGQLGIGTTSGNSKTPVQVAGLTDVVDFTVGHIHTCALTGNGTLWCWGAQNMGLLGNGTADSAKIGSPLAVAGAPATIERLEAGGQHTCLLDEKGELWCWGNNADRQVGLDHTLHPEVTVPTRIPIP